MGLRFGPEVSFSATSFVGKGGGVLLTCQPSRSFCLPDVRGSQVKYHKHPFAPVSLLLEPLTVPCCLLGGSERLLPDAQRSHNLTLSRPTAFPLPTHFLCSRQPGFLAFLQQKATLLFSPERRMTSALRNARLFPSWPSSSSPLSTASLLSPFSELPCNPLLRRTIYTDYLGSFSGRSLCFHLCLRHGSSRGLSSSLPQHLAECGAKKRRSVSRHVRATWPGRTNESKKNKKKDGSNGVEL